MSHLVDQLLGVPGGVVLLVTAAVVFAEDALFVGFLLPGETVAVLAGTSGMPYPRFLAFNAAGGLAWGVTAVLLGYAAGASYAVVEKSFGTGAAVVVLLVAVVALVVWRVRRHRAEATGRP